MTIPYVTGTVSVTAGSAVVTGSGTAWATALIAGGLFGLDSSNGNPVPILSVDSNTQLTLAKPWRGTTAAGQAYWIIRDTAYLQQLSANAQALATYIQRLDNAALAALAGLNPAADRLAYFTGAGSAALAPLSAFARTILDDADDAAVRATIGAFATSGGAVAGNSASVSSGVVQIRDSRTTVGDVVNTVLTINRQNSTVPALALGNDGNDAAVIASNNANVRFGKLVNGALSEYMRVRTDGRVYVGITGNLPSTAYGDVSVTRDGVAATGVSTNTTLYLERGTNNNFIQMIAGDASVSDLVMGSASASNRGRVRYDMTNDTMTLWTAQSESVRITGAGELRVPFTYNNTTASAANCYVSTIGGFARSTSSGRYKTDIEDLAPEYRDVIMQLRPVWYRSLCEQDKPDWSWYGLIAEEVAAVEPRLVHWRLEETYEEDEERIVPETVTRDIETGLFDADGRPILRREVQVVKHVEVEKVTKTRPLAEPVAEGVMYDRLVAHLIAKIQHQQGQIDDLLGRLAALEAAA
ncbi:tail fiber domain-containing protein [Sinorhizobium meliloti]|uniref:tail fiber domain-containing protein n=1 Tax=Rhizobium meliloti TaxID=382 RepID=UPI000FD1CE4D|nr:tail fiber domain-containing protein [Sinorhizobium meliloti]